MQIDYFKKKVQSSRWLPIIVTNYRCQNAHFAVSIDYFETGNTAIGTPKHTISHPCMERKNSNAINGMIM